MRPSPVFTPIFFGAQLRIPTSEDIFQPGRLAKWLLHHRCSITHLTPAMGQLLTANAHAPISFLRLAFFVGDILTRRDVTRLQALAANVLIVNMYGTTETQRAVSFLKIPNDDALMARTKDLIHAGQVLFSFCNEN